MMLEIIGGFNSIHSVVQWISFLIYGLNNTRKEDQILICAFVQAEKTVNIYLSYKCIPFEISYKIRYLYAYVWKGTFFNM